MLIQQKEVHLWYVFDEQINDPGLLSRYQYLLNEKEIIRMNRFHFLKHRHQYLVSRALVRCVLSNYVAEVLPQEWQFSYNKYGKPFINCMSNQLPLQFNLSHTGKLIVMAVTLNNDIGVDVEYVHRKGKTISLADSYFAPVEAEHLHDLSEEKQRERFFELWTLKEAYIKACGMGLSIPLNHFSYLFPDQGKVNIVFEPERNDQPEKWQFWHICPNKSHRVSVAIKKDKINTPCVLSMMRIVPLSYIHAVEYPIILQSAFPVKNVKNNSKS
jgi:4'-phosphopantetheinyl transferase